MSGNKLFGDWHGTPRGDAEDAEYTVTPVGIPCIFCQEPIKSGDVGEIMPNWRDVVTYEPVHRTCLLRNVLPPEMWERAGIKDD